MAQAVTLTPLLLREAGLTHCVCSSESPVPTAQCETEAPLLQLCFPRISHSPSRVRAALIRTVREGTRMPQMGTCPSSAPGSARVFVPAHTVPSVQCSIDASLWQAMLLATHPSPATALSRGRGMHMSRADVRTLVAHEAARVKFSYSPGSSVLSSAQCGTEALLL